MNVSTLQLKVLLNDVSIEIDKLQRQCELNPDQESVVSMRGQSYGMARVARMIEKEINNSKSS